MDLHADTCTACTQRHRHVAPRMSRGALTMPSMRVKPHTELHKPAQRDCPLTSPVLTQVDIDLQQATTVATFGS